MQALAGGAGGRQTVTTPQLVTPMLQALRNGFIVIQILRSIECDKL